MFSGKKRARHDDDLEQGDCKLEGALRGYSFKLVGLESSVSGKKTRRDVDDCVETVNFEETIRKIIQRSPPLD
jgi:hypothetical protein